MSFEIITRSKGSNSGGKPDYYDQAVLARAGRHSAQLTFPVEFAKMSGINGHCLVFVDRDNKRVKISPCRDDHEHARKVKGKVRKQVFLARKDFTFLPKKEASLVMNIQLVPDGLVLDVDKMKPTEDR